MSSRSSRGGAIVGAFTLLIAAAAVPVHANPNCTPDQGQLFIDEGLYKQAIKEFTCVIAADPTGVDGYRGRGSAYNAFGGGVRLDCTVERDVPHAGHILRGRHHGHSARVAQVRLSRACESGR